MKQWNPPSAESYESKHVTQMSNIQQSKRKLQIFFKEGGEGGGVINDLILYDLLKVWIMEL